MTQSLCDYVDFYHAIPGVNELHSNRPRHLLADLYAINGLNRHDRRTGAGEKRFFSIVDIIRRQIGFGQLTVYVFGEFEKRLSSYPIQNVFVTWRENPAA